MRTCSKECVFFIYKKNSFTNHDVFTYGIESMGVYDENTCDEIWRYIFT